MNHLEVVDEAKLLGVVIDSDLKWDKNTRYLVKKANKRMRMLHMASKLTKKKESIKNKFTKHFLEVTLSFPQMFGTAASQRRIDKI